MSALLTDNLPLLAGAPNGIKKLRELILELAVRGKLLPQDPSDEPASELLKRIAEEKARLVAEGKIKKQKPLLEISEDEWPFEVPASWAYARLSEITTKLTDGSHNPPKDAGSGFPMLSSRDVTAGKIRFDSPSRYLSVDDFGTEDSRTRIQPGDVLLTIVASLGRSAVVPIDAPKFALQRSVAVIASGLYPDFLSNLLNSPVSLKYFDAHAKGTAQKGIYLGKLGEYVTPVPPLAEQHRIVAKVDELMALCDRLEARQADADSDHAQLVQALLGSLTQASDTEDFAQSWQRLAEHFHTLFTTESSIDALKQTLLQLAVMGKLVAQDSSDEPAELLMTRLRRDRSEWLIEKQLDDPECKTMLRKLSSLTDALPPFPLPESWVTVHLIDCCRLLVDCHNKTAPYVPAGIPIIRTSNIRNREFRFDDLKYVNEETYEFWSRRCPPEPRDIMFTREAPMGEAAIIPDGERFCLGQRTMLVRPMHEYIDNRYLLIALTEPHLLERASTSAIGSTVKHLRVGDVELLNIPLPPLPEQHRIVAKVDQLMALCDQLKARLNQARQVHGHLASALVEQAVT